MKKFLTLLLLATTFSSFCQDLPLKNSNAAAKDLLANKLPKPATISPCAGGNVSIPSNISGNSYQWQVNPGSGFTNISNGGIYSGATTNTLQITGAPSSLYGYEYRCMVDGNFSAVYVLLFSTTWTGTVDNMWENGTNWSCGSVPDSFTDVIINSGSPMLSSNASVRTLTMSGANTVTVKTGFKLTVAH